jgi:hypothetical protein
MIIRGISLADIEAAADVASPAIGNRIIPYEVHPVKKRETAWKLRLKVASLDKPGSRLHLHSYLLGFCEKPRRSRHACGHTVGAFLVGVFERNPYCRVSTTFMTYKDAWNFLGRYQEVLDTNIGSKMCPVRLADSCSCLHDEVCTASLEQWRWRPPGVPELPNPQNTETVKC